MKTAKPVLDIAYEIVKSSKTKVPFARLWKELSKEIEYAKSSENDRMAEFYTQITFDKRFINIGDNKWDLRERHSYDKVHISMNDIYSELDKQVEDEFNEEDFDKVVMARKENKQF